MKFFSNSAVANFSTYAKLILLLYLAWSDHGIVDRIRNRDQAGPIVGLGERFGDHRVDDHC